jgi:hypothetical protein
MFPLLKRVLPALVLLLSGASFFLSAWIIVPAPTLRLLVLGVGVPEISPWLLVLSVFSLSMSLLTFRRSHWRLFTLFSSLVALFLSSLPLVQLPNTQQQMAANMQDGLGANYLVQIPADVQKQMRQQPFSLVDGFKGIST